MDRPHRLTLVALILAAVALITALAVGGILSAQTAASDARRAKDVSLALAYENRRAAISECQRSNTATAARIATAEAIVNIGAHANPALGHDLRSQLLLVAYIRKVNAEIEKQNRVTKCTWPALGLPKLPTITAGAREILEQSSGKVGGTVTSVASRAPSTAGRRPTTTTTETTCGCPERTTSTTHCVKRANRGTCRGKP